MEYFIFLEYEYREKEKREPFNPQSTIAMKSARAHVISYVYCLLSVQRECSGRCRIPLQKYFHILLVRTKVFHSCCQQKRCFPETDLWNYYCVPDAKHTHMFSGSTNDETKSWRYIRGYAGDPGRPLVDPYVASRNNRGGAFISSATKR